jgi:hypothetical protein
VVAHPIGNNLKPPQLGLKNRQVSIFSQKSLPKKGLSLRAVKFCQDLFKGRPHRQLKSQDAAPLKIVFCHLQWSLFFCEKPCKTSEKICLHH